MILQCLRSLVEVSWNLQIFRIYKLYLFNGVLKIINYILLQTTSNNQVSVFTEKDKIRQELVKEVNSLAIGFSIFLM